MDAYFTKNKKADKMLREQRDELAQFIMRHPLERDNMAVICGGESGPNARPMHPDWVRSLRDQCAGAGVPFMFKQWGEWAPNCLCQTKHPHADTPRPEPGKPGCMFRCGIRHAGRLLDGVEHLAMPEVRP